MIKILIAEDEIYARKSLLQQINDYDSQSISVLEAENGREALQIFKEEFPDLVITDIRMPIIDGLKLLEEIRKLDPNAAVMIASAYSDFNYAKSALKYGAVDYLIKPIKNAELYETLDKFLGKSEKKTNIIDKSQDMVSRYLEKILLNEVAPPRDFIAENLFSRIFNEYQIAAVYFADNKAPEFERAAVRLTNIEENTVWTSFRLLLLRKNLWVILLKTDAQNPYRLKRFLQYLYEKGSSSYIGISNTREALSSVSEAYQEALYCLESRLLVKQRLIEYRTLLLRSDGKNDGDGQGKGSGRTLLADHDFHLYQIALEKGNGKGASDIICQLFKRISDAESSYESGAQPGGSLQRGGGSHPAAFPLTVQDIEPVLTRFVYLFSQYDLKCSLNLLYYDSFDQLKNRMLEATGQICQKQAAESRAGADDTITEIQEYISKNYSTDITLKYLAEQVFFMNPDYLSHLFMERVGESFSSYLRRIRMEKAKELLYNEHMLIANIGELLGYHDTSLFIKTFKQYVGVTPRQYRKGLKNGRLEQMER